LSFEIVCHSSEILDRSRDERYTVLADAVPLNSMVKIAHDVARMDVFRMRFVAVILSSFVNTFGEPGIVAGPGNCK